MQSAGLQLTWAAFLLALCCLMLEAVTETGCEHTHTHKHTVNLTDNKPGRISSRDFVRSQTGAESEQNQLSQTEKDINHWHPVSVAITTESIQSGGISTWHGTSSVCMDAPNLQCIRTKARKIIKLYETTAVLAGAQDATAALGSTQEELLLLNHTEP